MIPKQFYRPTTVAFGLDELINHQESYDNYKACYSHPSDSEVILGYVLPPFQRPPVWTEAQNVAFIESAWLGYHLGTYTINKVEKWISKNKMHPFEGLLIDGQQRLRALHAYINDEFKVFGLFWSETSDIEKRRFGGVTFTQSRVSFEEIDYLKELYNRMNFGGTAHTEDQRA